MEFFNNIWTALTTDNELIIKFITVPGTFVEIYLSFCLFTSILKTDYSKKQKMIYIISVSLVSIITSMSVPQPFNVLINYAFIFLVLKQYFNYNIIQRVLSIVIPLGIFGLVNSFIYNPLIKLFNITVDDLMTIPIYRIIYLSVTYLLLLLLLLIFKHVRFNLKNSFNFNDKRTKTVILGNLVLGILTLFIQAFINFYYINNVPIVFTFFNFILLLVYFVTSIYSLTKAMKLDIATRDLENAESYNNSLTVLYDNVRGFKHDFDNIVNSISGYIKVDDMEGLKKYFTTFEKDLSKVKNVQLLNPNIINNPAIYNLIVSKYKRASDLGITINFEFFFDFNNLKMPIYDFSRILGILLDNSIEAAKDCDEKIINLLFRDSQNQHIQIIKIENTYLDKNIDTKKIFEKGVSGKDSHSGIGLWEVSKIIKKNNNLILTTTKDEKLFKQELQINY